MKTKNENTLQATDKAVVVHESAHLHVRGEATYTDDIPELTGTLHAAVGFAECAHGRIRACDLGAVRSAPGVVAVLTAADIPGDNNCGPVVHDEPLLAEDSIHFYGQAVFLVVAQTRIQARAAARLAHIDYDPAPPILTLEEAVAAESWVLPPMEFTKGDVDTAFVTTPHRLSGSLSVGGQEHFYLEGQIAYAVPQEDASMHVYCSTQHPTEMQLLVAHALDWAAHRVAVECRRMGGGFGGKESQSAQWACLAAVAANATGRPVKLRLDRDDDMSATGKRHGYVYDWQAAFDDDGVLKGLQVTMAANCGASVDLSGAVNERTLCHIGNAYYLDAVAVRSLRCRTHTVSNTAFRGFGGPQGLFLIESVMDDIARYLHQDPLAVRCANFFAEVPGDGRDHTHYGAEVRDFVLGPLVAQLVDSSDYHRRRAAVAKFNGTHQVIKRGIALTPVMFGISFNAVQFNQAGAAVYVYQDGSVAVTHGGTEMGQGLYTKMRQVAATELGVPLDRVRLLPTDTSRVANTSATAASSGTDLNGMAVHNACAKIRARLAQLAAHLSQTAAEQVVFADGWVTAANGQNWSYNDLVKQAYLARIQLWDSGFYLTPEIHYDGAQHLGRPFFYYAYGAAVSEVAIDTLTGESRVLGVDILHDVGRSMNPAIDIGQIEGGFVQGMGWLTSEELFWCQEGDRAGQLMTHAPSTYKIPTAYDVPAHWQVALFDNQNVADTIYRSKAVGEPPFMLAISVFSAIRQAVQAAAGEDQIVNLAAPATPEAILKAITESQGRYSNSASGGCGAVVA